MIVNEDSTLSGTNMASQFKQSGTNYDVTFVYGSIHLYGV